MDEHQAEILRRATEMLSEAFESALILASTKAPDGGVTMDYRTCGNHYAARGMAHAFIDGKRAERNAGEIGQVLNGD